ncbi:MAG: hypothetical protein WKF53_12390 [Rubrobacter sp.]
MKQENPFQRRVAPEPPEQPTEQPAVQADKLADDELEAALIAARRELLDAQHAEVRRLSKAQHVPAVGGEAIPESSSGLAQLLNTKTSQRRKSWR